LAHRRAIFARLLASFVGVLPALLGIRCETQMNSDSPSAQLSRAEWFASTHWSVVLAAKEGDPATASAALEQLCRTYWPPLYAFIRREGYDEAEAKDLTQEFFLRLIDREFLQRLRHQQGKFRSFLLTFLKNFLLEQRGKSKAQKRGGGKVIVSLDQIAEGAPISMNQSIAFHQTRSSSDAGRKPFSRWRSIGSVRNTSLRAKTFCLTC
jgi:hypothetical protein